MEDDLAAFMNMVMDRLQELEKSFDRVEKDVSSLKIFRTETRKMYTRNIERLRQSRKALFA